MFRSSRLAVSAIAAAALLAWSGPAFAKQSCANDKKRSGFADLRLNVNNQSSDTVSVKWYGNSVSDDNLVKSADLQPGKSEHKNINVWKYQYDDHSAFVTIDGDKNTCEVTIRNGDNNTFFKGASCDSNVKALYNVLCERTFMSNKDRWHIIFTLSDK
jgi:hypothetical protein